MFCSVLLQDEEFFPEKNIRQTELLSLIPCFRNFTPQTKAHNYFQELSNCFQLGPKKLSMQETFYRPAIIIKVHPANFQTAPCLLIGIRAITFSNFYTGRSQETAKIRDRAQEKLSLPLSGVSPN